MIHQKTLCQLALLSKVVLNIRNYLSLQPPVTENHKMTKIFKKIRELFLNQNVWISRTTDKQQLLDFFESVRPKKQIIP